MKLIPLSILLVIAACGKKPTSENRLGEIRPINAQSVASGADQQKLALICNALSLKSGLLNSNSTSSVYTFDLQESNCDGGTMPTSGTVPVRIDGVNFRRADNNALFAFPSVETVQNGSLSEVCSTGLLQRTANNEVQEIVLSNISGPDCTTGTDQLCVLIQRGPIIGNSFKVHTREWMKINTNPNRPFVGFYTERKMLSSSFCELNKSISIKATLKTTQL